MPNGVGQRASAESLANLRPAWQRGQSGNSQNNHREYQRFVRVARITSMEMLELAIACARNPEAPWSARLNAALSVIDRAWGKPKEHLQLDTDGIAALRIEFVSPGAQPEVDARIDGKTIELSLTPPDE